MTSALTQTLIVSIMVLVSVAFFTLLERKVLGGSQLRKGPNKVSLLGILQPVSDAVKLFLKEINLPYLSPKFIFFFSPTFAIFLVLLMWTNLPFSVRTEAMSYSGIVVLLIMSLTLYPMLMSGWSSMSVYSLIGATRGVAQTISYEISLAILLMAILVNFAVLSLEDMIYLTSHVSTLWFVVVLFLVTSFAETNRTPFDFAEGESELVSGFNIEYGGGTFAAMFMAEYASIMVFSFLISLIMFFGKFESLGVLVSLLLMILWVWVRATLPRYRYDMLMNMAWKTLLPASLGSLLYLNSL